MTEDREQFDFDDDKLSAVENCKRFRHEAMATPFEILIAHDDAEYAAKAARAAFDGLDRLENQLSRFIENSDISRINKQPPNEPVRIGLGAFECIELAIRIYEQTNGAFDITVGAAGEKRVGSHLIKLNADEHSVELAGPVRIDLGGIGKGYAVDKIAQVLKDWSIDKALIHGGSSSVLALGSSPWPVTLSRPGEERQIIAEVDLRNMALSCSNLEHGSHIIDPETSLPIDDKITAWSFAPDAGSADALSTAFMVMTQKQVEEYCIVNPNISAILIVPRREATTIVKYGSLGGVRFHKAQ